MKNWSKVLNAPYLPDVRSHISLLKTIKDSHFSTLKWKKMPPPWKLKLLSAGWILQVSKNHTFPLFILLTLERCWGFKVSKEIFSVGVFIYGRVYRRSKLEYLNLVFVYELPFCNIPSHTLCTTWNKIFCNITGSSVFSRLRSAEEPSAFYCSESIIDPYPAGDPRQWNWCPTERFLGGGCNSARVFLPIATVPQ